MRIIFTTCLLCVLLATSRPHISEVPSSCQYHEQHRHIRFYSTRNICIRIIKIFFVSVFLYNKKAEESITSLIGVAVGGGLFLTVLMVGVLIWISREREEDEEVMEEAQKLQGSRRRRNLSQLRPKQEKKYLPSM